VIKVNDGEGNVLLSRKNVESKKIWDSLMQDDQITDKVFEGMGKEVVKGGLIATIDGIRAFVPASQLSTKYVENIGDFVGKPIHLKVIEVDKARKRIVASHKAVMLAEAEEARRQKWAELEIGSRVTGVVRRLTDFGAFVDIGGGIDGLVHVTDVAWGRVKHPKDVLSVNQEVEVIIRDVDIEKQRVSLGYKQLQPKPWTMADQKYPVGTIVEGKVVRIVPFGAFIALEPTIDGLIHISQVGVKRIAKVEDEINVGDIVRCKVLDVNVEAKRISLSRREALLDEHPEIVEELAAERAERDRANAERAEQRAAAEASRQQQQQERRTAERADRNDRPERRERGDRPRREENDYDLPPVQSVSTSMADIFAAAIGSSEATGDKEE
jgi:4-hydroxy-3-methylbut-2-enyl diphosphate reductase